MGKEFAISKRPVIVIGAGGHALVLGATLTAAGYEVAAYFDDDAEKWGRRLGDVEVKGPISEAVNVEGSPGAVIGIGDNRVRKGCAERLELDWISVVHPFAWVAPGVSIGPGSAIFAGSVVQPGATIGRHVIVNTRSSVDHDVVVGDYVHVAMSHLAGGSSAGEGAFMALASTVMPGVRVGEWATVGAASLVKRDVRPETTVIGVPAKEIVFPGSSGDPGSPPAKAGR